MSVSVAAKTNEQGRLFHVAQNHIPLPKHLEKKHVKLCCPPQRFQQAGPHDMTIAKCWNATEAHIDDRKPFWPTYLSE